MKRLRQWWLLHLQRRRNDRLIQKEMDERVRRFLHEKPDMQVRHICDKGLGEDITWDC